MVSQDSDRGRTREDEALDWDQPVSAGASEEGDPPSLSDSLPVISVRNGIISAANDPFAVTFEGSGHSGCVGQPLASILLDLPESTTHLISLRSLPGMGEWRPVEVSVGSGAVRPALASTMTPMPDTEEETIVVLPVQSMRDVSSLSDAEAAEMRTKQFIALISNLVHELRTPLNAVIGFSDIMKNELLGEIPSGYKQYSEDINESANHLLSIIDDVLDLGRMTFDDGAIQESVVSVGDLFTRSVGLVRESAAAKNIGMSIEEGDAPTVVYVDERRMIQVILNLLANSVKYSDDGQAVVLRHKLDEDGSLRLEVADRGRGMSPDEITRVVLPFARSEAAIRSREQGVGLGLAIANTIMKRHGGKLEIESALGMGTTVSLIIPADRLIGSADIHSGHSRNER